MSKWMCRPSEKRSTLKGKNFLESKFFPFRVDPFCVGDWNQESKQEVGKRSLVKRGEKVYQLLLVK